VSHAVNHSQKSLVSVSLLERYRIRAEAADYYLTYSVVEWLPVFVSQASCKIVTGKLQDRDR
jgi:hypothetical protein